MQTEVLFSFPSFFRECREVPSLPLVSNWPQALISAGHFWQIYNMRSEGSISSSSRGATDVTSVGEQTIRSDPVSVDRIQMYSKKACL